jgi:hypothetical protein
MVAALKAATLKWFFDSELTKQQYIIFTNSAGFYARTNALKTWQYYFRKRKSNPVQSPQDVSSDLEKNTKAILRNIFRYCF